MSPEAPLHIPRARYGLITAASAVAALVVGGVVSAAFGGGSEAVRVVVTALAAGVVVALVPAVASISVEYWGVAVLACGLGRALLSLGIAYTTVQASPELGSRPVMVGVAAGAVLMLVVETVASVRVLSAIEKAKDELKTAALGREPGPMERV